MPWSEPMAQKKEFIRDALAGIYSVTELCQRHGISRKTGHKYLRRYRESGLAGLEERSRRPHRIPKQTPEHVVDAILHVRDLYPRWGASKVLAHLERSKPELADLLPSRSTAHQYLKRTGRVKLRRRRRSLPPSRGPVTEAKEPNELWAIDFKGEFKTWDGQYCYPLTITDSYSRYILCCEALPSTKMNQVEPVMHRVFKQYGLPRVMLSDNGAPFASTGLARLTRLSAWWLKLGIEIERIDPGEPQQNGRHERMHRELKAECTRPPEAHLEHQQESFNYFTEEYNTIRPHEALQMKVPADLYCQSERSYPGRNPPIKYPDFFMLRKVSSCGLIKINDQQVFVSGALRGEKVGIYEIDHGVWSINYAHAELGRYDLPNKKFHTGGVMGPNRINKDDYFDV